MDEIILQDTLYSAIKNDLDWDDDNNSLEQSRQTLYKLIEEISLRDPDKKKWADRAKARIEKLVRIEQLEQIESPERTELTELIEQTRLMERMDRDGRHIFAYSVIGAGIEELKPYVCNPLNAKSIADLIPTGTDAYSLDDVVDPLISYLYKNPRFIDVTGEFQPFTIQEAKEILLPNLACLLLSDYTRLGEKTYSLKEVMESYNSNVDPARASRHKLNDYPMVFRHLFGIKKKKHGRYRIKTRYPRLLAAIIDSQGDIPFWRTKPTSATSWNKNSGLMGNCLNVIFPKGEVPIDGHIEDGHVMYYCIEIIFRINTKMKLFFAQSKIKGEQELVSPKLLGTFFFSSPLVYIPDETISACTHSEKYLHILIQLSAYWFPVLYHGINYYIIQKNLTDHDSLANFLQAPIADLQSKYKSSELTKLIDHKMTRGKIQMYDKSWRDFRPSQGYFSGRSYEFLTISKWQKMYFSKAYTDNDRLVMAKIQRILQ